MALALLALLWLAIAPLYAHLLATVGRSMIPVLEGTPGTRYLVNGSLIVAVRPISLPAQEATTIRRRLWAATSDYNVALLAALVLATPGWTLRQRFRALAWGLGLLGLTHLVSFLINVEYTQLWPIRTNLGPLHPQGFSRPKLILFDWLYSFFEYMGRGYFALLLYWGLLTFTWGRPDALTRAHSVSRNDPCPCGSGLKYKRCCGA